MDFKQKYKTERDVEIPLFLDFIKKHSPIKSVFDIGCSHAFYAPEIRKLVKTFDGIDFESDKIVVELLDNFYQGDFMGGNFRKYDLISAISVIEHYGIKQRPEDNWNDKQIEMVEKIGRLSNKYIFLTFPYGQLKVIPGEFAVIDDVLLAMFEDVLDNFVIEKEFYFNPDSLDGFLWSEIEEARASGIIQNSGEPVACVCILKGTRKNV